MVLSTLSQSRVRTNVTHARPVSSSPTLPPPLSSAFDTSPRRRAESNRRPLVRPFGPFVRLTDRPADRHVGSTCATQATERPTSITLDPKHFQFPSLLTLSLSLQQCVHVGGGQKPEAIAAGWLFVGTVAPGECVFCQTQKRSLDLK